MNLLARAVVVGSTGALLSTMYTTELTAQSRGERAIYGQDDRLDLYEVNDPKLLELARATGVLVHGDEVSPEGDDRFRLATVPYHKYYDLCPNVRFREQPLVGFCSGFLVGPDLFATAGHCVRTSDRCEEMRIVFGFGLEARDQDLSTVPASDVYRCVERVAQVLDRATGRDHALVRLDRPVTGRTPLAVRRSGRVAYGAPLIMIGNPKTMPTKIVGGRSRVRDETPLWYFTSSLDAYAGNSGSAVLNAQTHEVEGILVRGDEDFVTTSEGCKDELLCSEGGCLGEDVSRISPLLSYLPGGSGEPATPSEPTTPVGPVTPSQPDPEEPDEPQMPSRPATPIAGVPRPPFGATPRLVSTDSPAVELAIPDATDAGVSVEIPVDAHGWVDNVGLQIRLEHGRPADLRVVLIAPDGTQAVLREPSPHMQVIGTFSFAFGTSSSSIGLHEMAPFRGREAKGTWRVVVSDRRATATGRIRDARLRLDVL